MVPAPASTRMIVRARLALSSCKAASAASTRGCNALPQLHIARKQAICAHFLIVGGQHAAQLSASAVILPGKIALGSKSRFGAAWQAAHVHIQQLKAGLVVMLEALAVLSKDLIEPLLQLRHICC